MNEHVNHHQAAVSQQPWAPPAKNRRFAFAAPYLRARLGGRIAIGERIRAGELPLPEANGSYPKIPLNAL